MSVPALPPSWVLLQDDAEEMITASVCGGDSDCLMASMELLGALDAPTRAAAGLGDSSRDNGGDPGGSGSHGGSSGDSEYEDGNGNGNGSSSSSSRWDAPGDGWQGEAGAWQGAATASGRNGSSAAPQRQAAELALDMDSWQQIGYPNAVLAAVVACKNGVKRAHLVDADSDGCGWARLGAAGRSWLGWVWAPEPARDCTARPLRWPEPSGGSLVLPLFWSPPICLPAVQCCWSCTRVTAPRASA